MNIPELGTFALTYPCYILLHEDSFPHDEAGRPTGPITLMKCYVIDHDGGKAMFPFFTDGDLAVRFLRASGEAKEWKVVAAHNAEMLISAIEGTRGTCDSVTVDKPAMLGKPFRIWPIEYAIEKIHANEHL